MNSKKHFMAVALWILSAAVVAADKPPQPAGKHNEAKGQPKTLAMPNGHMPNG